MKMNDFYCAESFDAVAYKEYLRYVKIEKNVLSYLVPNGHKILRTRVNDDGLLFDNLAKLSYPPKDKARTDRASLEGKPMFYGSVFTHQNDNIIPPRVINLIESSDFYRDNKSVGEKIITQSAWQNNRHLKLAMLPISLNYKEPCDELKSFQTEFYNVANAIGMRISEDALYLGNLFAVAGTSRIYNMTANYVDYLLNESDVKDYFDGVIYPSVPSEGLGCNICIRPSLIDEGVVQFLGASSMLLVKDEMESKMSQLFDCDIVGDGDLIWHNSEMLNKAIVNPELFSELLYI